MKTLIHKPKLKRLDFLDQRFYVHTDEFGNESYFPSCTEILSIYPKGHGFESWLKDVGNNASQIADRAAATGSKVHHAAELLHAGQELKWLDDNGVATYSLQEWEMILKYADFWNKIKPVFIAVAVGMSAA